MLPVGEREPDTPAPHRFSGPDPAAAWCRQHFDALAVAIDAAPAVGKPELAPRIAVHMYGYAVLDMTVDWYGCLEKALSVARDHGDRWAEAWVLHRMGDWHQCWERAESVPVFEQALPMHRALGDRLGELWVLANLTNVYSTSGRSERAIAWGQEALTAYAARPEPPLPYFELAALGGIGLAHSRLGQYEQAVEYICRSLALHPPADRSRNHAIGLDNLGEAYRALGRFDEAIAALEESLDLFVRNDDRRGQSDALHTLGRIFQETGHADGARECWKQSLDLAEEIGFRPAIERAQASLDALDA
ncbi:tetratricopeptide repeat protein [Catenulispora sp. GAS73]|uniref:tetratricopeptide repeat protein n=1 Tax=Catenulispora sp. GAS73 TaxID=3156269 RepID=UPI00351220F5